MRLTLAITMPGYDAAVIIARTLQETGFNSTVSSPSNGVYEVLVKTRPEYVNQGKDIFEELKLASDLATDLLVTAKGED